jgi:hypothetical protein
VMMLRPDDEGQRTPKLGSVSRWLARMDALGEADWDSVVWIDDVLGPDARESGRTRTVRRCSWRSRRLNRAWLKLTS